MCVRWNVACVESVSEYTPVCDFPCVLQVCVHHRLVHVSEREHHAPVVERDRLAERERPPAGATPSLPGGADVSVAYATVQGYM